LPQPANQRRFREVIMAAILTIGHRLSACAFRVGLLLLAGFIMVSCAEYTGERPVEKISIGERPAEKASIEERPVEKASVVKKEEKSAKSLDPFGQGY
jgi:hypothetical protein